MRCRFLCVALRRSVNFSVCVGFVNSFGSTFSLGLFVQFDVVSAKICGETDSANAERAFRLEIAHNFSDGNTQLVYRILRVKDGIDN